MGEFYVFKHCPICGGRFHVPFTGNWAYKTYYKGTDQVLMCSWKCMRQAQSMVKKVRNVKRGG